MLHPVPTLKETPSQTAGPYVHIGMTPNFCGITGVIGADPGVSMLTPTTKGQRIDIVGRVFDGSGAPVTDAVIELWQADANGSFVTPPGRDCKSPPDFLGWVRQPTDADGAFTFQTIKPGPVAGPDGRPQAPHVSLWIVARGINMGLQTRLYFSDEAEANADDYVLNKIMDRRRRPTLIAQKQDGDLPRYVLDIHLQGPDETVFFDF
jgi:protocatechuate 3,4-dioxygenase alpha subunit